MHISNIYEQLIEEARRRVSSGIVTERRLARLCGISQSHMHNVLKSFRSLSRDNADKLMDTLHIDIAELMFRFQKVGSLDIRAVPLVRSRVGAGLEPVLSIYRGFVPFSSEVVDELIEPVVIQLAPDMVMPKLFKAGDYVLLDQNPRSRSRPRSDDFWLVNEPIGTRIRYVRFNDAKVYVANELTVGDPAQWTPIPLKNKPVTTVVLARVAWFGRLLSGPEGCEERPNIRDIFQRNPE